MSNVKETLKHNLSFIFFAMLMISIGLLGNIQQRLEEMRTWRDITRATPFYQVEIINKQNIENGVKVSGTFIKRRCEFIELSSYVKIKDTWYRIKLDTSPEDNGSPKGNRPAIDEPQNWGPWILKWEGSTPTDWAIYAHHYCMEGNQINLFASGKW